jgi:hypothetical protein
MKTLSPNISAGVKQMMYHINKCSIHSDSYIHKETEGFSVNLVLLAIYTELINMSVTYHQTLLKIPFIIQKNDIVPHIIKSSVSQYETEQQLNITNNSIYHYCNNLAPRQA